MILRIFSRLPIGLKITPKTKQTKKKNTPPKKNKKQKPKNLNCVLQTDDSLRMTWEGDLDMEQEA